MKIPKIPPSFSDLIHGTKRIDEILELSRSANPVDDLHWDKLRRRSPPAGFTSEEWWLAIKWRRIAALKAVPLLDTRKKPFQFGVPDLVQQELHRIDMGAGRAIGVLEPITNPQTRDRYLIRSLMEEAITSSQLEGAATTRDAAKEMLRSGRPPRDIDEQMILNNYLTMQRIVELKQEPLSAQMVMDMHGLVTDKTLEAGSGRFRREDELRVVCDISGEVYHNPPVATELPTRMDAMCAFANGQMPDFFVHPVVRAIILHFWLAYDHPFVDGNGRTARALFYWAMLRAGYWLFEFISISTILRKAPIKYARSFLYTETDDNDLTYFIVSQTRVIRRAIQELHDYLDRKTAEVRELETHLRALDLFNHRQADLIRYALKHPFQEYTIAGHAKSHNVVYQTARADMLDLKERGVLEVRSRGKKMIFRAAVDLGDRLRKLEKEDRG